MKLDRFGRVLGGLCSFAAAMAIGYVTLTPRPASALDARGAGCPACSYANLRADCSTLEGNHSCTETYVKCIQVDGNNTKTCQDVRDDEGSQKYMCVNCGSAWVGERDCR
jgi:hypothetical protein